MVLIPNLAVANCAKGTAIASRIEPSIFSNFWPGPGDSYDNHDRADPPKHYRKHRPGEACEEARFEPAQLIGGANKKAVHGRNPPAFVIGSEHLNQGMAHYDADMIGGPADEEER